MSFQYRTEYCLGRRGRVCRTYGGIQALIAIAFDLALGLVFGLVRLAFALVGLGLRLARSLAVSASRVALALLSLPLKLARAVLTPNPSRGVAKPAWAGLDEM